VPVFPLLRRCLVLEMTCLCFAAKCVHHLVLSPLLLEKELTVLLSLNAVLLIISNCSQKDGSAVKQNTAVKLNTDSVCNTVCVCLSAVCLCPFHCCSWSRKCKIWGFDSSVDEDLSSGMWRCYTRWVVLMTWRIVELLEWGQYKWGGQSRMQRTKYLMILTLYVHFLSCSYYKITFHVITGMWCHVVW
jgi:hypothetical protein